MRMDPSMSTAPDTTTTTVELPRATTDGWSSAVTESMTRYALPGLGAAVAVRGDLVWSAGFGLADIGRALPVTGDTLFRLASVTKLVTATAVLALQDSGELSLEDPVSRWVPSFPPSAATIRHLLCHGSGMQRETPNDPGWRTGRFRSDEDFRAAIGESEFPFAPMERWKYSNLGYNTLGEVVEAASDQPYAEFVMEHVIEPLGMNGTGFYPGTGLRERLAKGYIRIPDQDAVVEDPKGWAALPAPAGQLFSTAESVVRLGSFLAGDLEKGPLSPGTLEEMRRPQIIADEGWSQGHGLGPMLVRDASSVLVGHAGGLFGYAAWLLASPKSHVAAVCLTNVGDGAPLLPLVQRFISEASEVVPAELPAPAMPPTAEAAELLGRYWGDGEVVSLVWKGGNLVGQWPLREGLTRGPDMTLEREDRDVYRFVDHGPYVGELLRVERDDYGRVRGFEVCTYGYRRL